MANFMEGGFIKIHKVLMKETLITISSMEMEFTNGLMDQFTMDLGKIM